MNHFFRYVGVLFQKVGLKVPLGRASFEASEDEQECKGRSNLLTCDACELCGMRDEQCGGSVTFVV